VLLTRPPLYSQPLRVAFASDLHVLGTPPALILSQDQTLKLNRSISPSSRSVWLSKNVFDRPDGSTRLPVKK
jgi:hypothetical protein